MFIRIKNDDGRRMAWTDKKNGFLDLSSSCLDMPDCGYWRGEQKYLLDFFLPSKGSDSDLYRPNADYTDVSPEGFTSTFMSGGEKRYLEVSLLLFEQAFFIDLRGDGPLPSEAGAGIILPSANRVPSVWSRHSPEGCTLWEDGQGVAVVSVAPFALEALPGGRICFFREGSPAPWYVAIEDGIEAARDKAIALVRKEAIVSHRALVSEFISSTAFRTENGRFDESVAWARYSGWMLVTEDRGMGVWAGLPEFRDNWSRDTFVSLTGLLLVSGRFEESRAVLLTFASRQNLDPSSENYGRIANLYRSDHDASYDAADGTLWFIRALWEYLQYSGDTGILDRLAGTVYRALDSDIRMRTDRDGLLVHGSASTWMNASSESGLPFSPRGNRACEIEALWYTALLVGAGIARLRGDDDRVASFANLAAQVRSSFNRLFWSAERNALADCLYPGPQGSTVPDFRVRPNQLFAITAPSVFRDRDGDFLPEGYRKAVLENVNRELVSPYGLFTLCPDDPLFHPRHENPSLYADGAAAHNGTIWTWNTGAYVSACAMNRQNPWMSSSVSALLHNESSMILDSLCAGTLPGNIHAEPNEAGLPVFSGSRSQAWSVAEFSRNAFQDVLGFKPRLAEGFIDLQPHLPAGTERLSAEVVFGAQWRLSISVEADLSSGAVLCTLVWSGAEAGNQASRLKVNGRDFVPLVPLVLTFLAAPDGSASCRIPALPNAPVYRLSMFPERALVCDWCGAVHQKNYLERLIARSVAPAGAPGGLPAVSGELALEWFFDSPRFKRKYLSSVPLGAIHSSSGTTFRLWAPTARSVSLVLYPDGSDSPPTVVLPMQNALALGGNPGLWELAMSGDIHGFYYRYRIRVAGIVRDVPDPYARACGANGARSMVVDFSRTNPPRWNLVRSVKTAAPNDIVAYELHVADLTSSPFWNGDSRIARTYAGAAQRNTLFRGTPTGFDHLLSLGITHVQLMPVFDFSSVDENRLHDVDYANALVGGNFNWGYDPANYFAPEGSYSTDPRDGVVRVRELKTLIREFLAAGIGVIMDVVYNHVPSSGSHPLGMCVPGYYFRGRGDSGAGDDTASEREMFRAYMIDSLVWWLTEYKLSGFRFDLMGLHDIETMNAVAAALRRVKDDVILYGEGWDMYRGGKIVGASMIEARKLPDFGFFNDALRCGIKGPVFNALEGGFIHDGSRREAVKFGLVGAVYHPQVHNRLIEGTANRNPWSDRTAASVNYAEIHDNLTLYDKLVLVEPGKSASYYKRLQKTAISLVLLAQGMPVLHAGMEFMRTKEIPPDLAARHPELADLCKTADGGRTFSHNSYNLGDRINGLDWQRSAENQDLVSYVRFLVGVRKAHPLFRLRTAQDVVLSLSFIDSGPEILCWVIDACTTVDPWQSACMVVNCSDASVTFALPPCSNGGSWHLVTDGDSFTPGDVTGPASPSRIDVGPKALYLYAEF